MKIALGADHAGFELKEKIKEYLLKKGGIEVIDKGTNSKESVDYPKYGPCPPARARRGSRP